MCSDKARAIEKLKSELKDKDGSQLKMLIGIDGFVDEILHAVDTRQDYQNFTRIKTIEDFGRRIIKAAGLSSNIELVPKQLKIGGNGPIFSNSLLEYGVRLTYVGAMGKEGIHPVFAPMAEKCEASYSLCDPGFSHATEFEDGKIIFGKLECFNEITWDRFKEVVGSPEKIAAMIDESCLLGMENWTMVPRMGNVLRGMLKEVEPLLKVSEGNPTLAFFDLADPEKRTASDILDGLSLISSFQKKFRVILGLNEKELYEIAEVLGITHDPNLPRDEKLKTVITETFSRLGIYCLVVHPMKEAIACVADGYFRVDGPYCPNPVLTTGAGDNFNSGFCFAQALGLDMESSLLAGVSTSGFYVKNGKSPTKNELEKFLQEWAGGEL